MTGKDFFQTVSNSHTDIIQILLNILNAGHVEYCVIGGLAVNAYTDPVVSLDLDLVVIAPDIERMRERVSSHGLTVHEFEHSINFSLPESDLRIQIQKDPRYQDFLKHAGIKIVLGYEMKVASVEDVLQGKLWAYGDETRRKSKRQKDLADIFRLVETHPQLKSNLPESLRAEFE